MITDVFITGSTGFVGRHLLASMLANPAGPGRIHTISRKFTGAAPPDRISHHTGDLAEKRDLAAFLSGPGVLVNLAYSAGTAPGKAETDVRLLLKYATKAGIRRLIHCSTAVIVGNTRCDRIAEDTKPAPVTEYEQVKLAIENIFLTEAPPEMEVLIVRPTAVFGPGGKNVIKLVRDRMFNSAVKNFLLDSVYGARTMNFVSVRKVVASLVHFIDLDSSSLAKPVREIMICSSDDARENNYHFLAREIRSRFPTRELPLPRIPFVSAVLPILLNLAGRSSTNPRRRYISSSAARLGFHYEKPFSQELQEYLDWLKTSGEVDRR